MFIGRTDIKAETLILWPPDVKSWLIWKDPVAGKDWGQEEKGTTEEEMVGWHHRPNGHEFGWTPGVGEGQACCSSWVTKSWTQLSNWTELKFTYQVIPKRHKHANSVGKETEFIMLVSFFSKSHRKAGPWANLWIGNLGHLLQGSQPPVHHHLSLPSSILSLIPVSGNHLLTHLSL